MLGLGVGIPKLVYPAPAGYVNSKSLNLDGTGDTVGLAFTDSEVQALLRSVGFTLSFWVNVSYDSSFDFFGHTDTGNVLAGSFRMSYLFLNSSVDLLTVSIKLGGSTGDSISLLNPTFTDTSNSWQHIAYTVARGADGSTEGTHSLYVNGSLIQSADTVTKTFSDATVTSSGRGMSIGSNDNNGTQSSHMTGLLDEIAVFAVELNASNVAAIYNSGVPFDLTENQGNYTAAAKLKRYYRFEDDTSQSTLSQDLGSDGQACDLQGNPTASSSVPS
tara:strand:+ start:1376 stop:2197 length:822 start_codon:yes stop_codon:yes gene_type:complete